MRARFGALVPRRTSANFSLLLRVGQPAVVGQMAENHGPETSRQRHYQPVEDALCGRLGHGLDAALAEPEMTQSEGDAQKDGCCPAGTQRVWPVISPRGDGPIALLHGESDKQLLRHGHGGKEQLVQKSVLDLFLLVLLDVEDAVEQLGQVNAGGCDDHEPEVDPAEGELGPQQVSEARMKIVERLPDGEETAQPDDHRRKPRSHADLH